LEAGDDIDEQEHKDLAEEYQFYQAVVNGDVETVQQNCERNAFVSDEGVGQLSRNPVTNLKYHFVITTALLTRLCRQKGMELEQAFRLSDFYIQKLDDLNTQQEVKMLHDEMVLDFAMKMKQRSRRDTVSKHISVCKEFIYAHIKERITVQELAEELGVSNSYLSRLFKKETGISVSDFIRNQKIEMAKNLLRFSDYSIIEIANRLSFSSQSHFIQQFREITGTTPKKYRNKTFRQKWNMLEEEEANRSK
ncbi:MAG: helix-turn-helix transcriptional regulator, partial [Eubacteriales bacterium]|nr:helix-turn-helix transcriptional regulator [Eubacteriales bacterium]